MRWKIGLIASSSGEIKGVRITRAAASAKCQVPQAGIHQRLVRRISDLAEKLPFGVVRVDGAVAKISHQDRVRKCSEGSRSRCHAPRRVEFAASRDEGAYKISVHVEDIHLPQASPRLGIVLGSILHGIGHVDLVTDDANAMGSKTRRKFRIGERTAQRSEVKIAIKDVDFPVIEVCRQKEGTVEQGETFVNRAAGRVIEGDCCGVVGAGPVGNEAVFCIKNELPAAEVDAISV
jgi:hypothetical protein